MDYEEFIKSKEFKIINKSVEVEDDSSVRFLDETLYEAIKELKTLTEDYRVVKKQNDYYNFEGRSCDNCVYKQCSNKEIMEIYNGVNTGEFWCNEWKELR